MKEFKIEIFRLNGTLQWTLHFYDSYYDKNSDADTEFLINTAKELKQTLDKISRKLE